eukprot:GFUD01110737.1.p1 GENE.GFUD01110737.1~~GFUD01110737.1.p1  ORF type:complete len:168 (+),score=30.21 GFUD01110737.1:124-627(+)
MADSVSKRQALLEELSYKKSRRNCPNTSLALSITPHSKETSQDDSGYTGFDSTPRPYRRRILRNTKPSLNVTPLPLYNQSTSKVIHYLLVLVVAASLCFGLLVGDMAREKRNMKYQAIQFGKLNSLGPGKGLTIVDRETGEVLGGKRAAIQFYHDQKTRNEEGNLKV